MKTTVPSGRAVLRDSSRGQGRGRRDPGGAIKVFAIAAASQEHTHLANARAIRGIQRRPLNQNKLVDRCIIRRGRENDGVRRCPIHVNQHRLTIAVARFVGRIGEDLIGAVHELRAGGQLESARPGVAIKVRVEEGGRWTPGRARPVVAIGQALNDKVDMVEATAARFIPCGAGDGRETRELGEIGRRGDGNGRRGWCRGCQS